MATPPAPNLSYYCRSPSDRRSRTPSDLVTWNQETRDGSNRTVRSQVAEVEEEIALLEQQIEGLRRQAKLRRKIKAMQEELSLLSRPRESTGILASSTNSLMDQVDQKDHVDRKDHVASACSADQVDRKDYAASAYCTDHPVAADKTSDSLVALLGRIHTPMVPERFEGDPLKYVQWKRSFNILIRSRCVPEEEQAYYLRQCLGGEALQAVEGLFDLDPTKCLGSLWKVLDDRFGDEFLIVDSFRRKLEQWPTVGSTDHKGLRRLSDFLNQCAVAKSQFEGLRILDDIHQTKILLKKLPTWIRRDWVKRADRVRPAYPGFGEFVEFIKEISDRESNPVFQDLSPAPPSGGTGLPGHKRARGLKTSSQEERVEKEKGEEVNTTEQSCLCCKKRNHMLTECYFLANKGKSEQIEFVKQNGLCFGCLKKDHISKNCPQRSTCKKCGKRHPSSLHVEKKVEEEEECEASTHRVSTERSSLTSMETLTHKVSSERSSLTSMVVPLWVSTKSRPEKRILTYGLLDTQSDASFISEDLAKSLDAPRTPVRLKLATLNSSTTHKCDVLSDVMVQGLNSSENFGLRCYTQDKIPIDISHIPTRATAEAWPHLRHLGEKIPTMQKCDVGLLIGYDCPRALAPREVVAGTGDEPYAIRTDVGWSIVGGYGPGSMSCRTVSREVPEIRTEEIVRALEGDFSDNHSDGNEISQDDLLFLQIMKGIHQTEEGYYEMPLPFKEPPSLPSNKDMAMKRLQGLKRKFKNDAKFKSDYRTFMEDMMSSGYAEEVPLDEVEKSDVWYIPHHGVYHPKKPTKIRVVFDCAATCQGASLNKCLLPGPDMMNSLPGILCRFRLGEIGLTCDVKQMFYQFRVDPKDRDYLRFLWWKSEEDEELTTYRMKVHLFGATSSPACANFGLRRIVEDHSHLYGERVCEFVRADFYVDDGLTAVQEVTEGISLMQEAVSLCARGNLTLHKFSSNEEEVIHALSSSEENSLQGLSGPSTERVLGMEWITGADQFRFNVQLQNQPSTRRVILASVASIFDPLGLIAPVVLTARLVLQETFSRKLSWDEPVPQDLEKKWTDWTKNLQDLGKTVLIPRCVMPKEAVGSARVEVHHFSDASTVGYGCCAYLRLVFDDRVICHLLCGKAKVAPMKAVSIPRMELSAAVLAVKMAVFLRKELRLPITSEHFWSDSKITLGYIANDSKRFHVFVANRVQQIRYITRLEQWNYVKSEENPADLVSRGASPEELVKSEWFVGPRFLRETHLPVSEQVSPEWCDGDPEVRTVHAIGAEVTDVILERIPRFSSWQNALSAFTCLRNKVRSHKGLVAEDQVQMRQETELEILRRVQARDFNKEISSLKKGQQVTRGSRLKKLDPFLDKKGLIRVGGRLSKSAMSFEVKHPIIVPQGHVAELIVSDQHERSGHQGRGMTTCKIRSSGYWILGCSRIVASHIHKCVLCRKLRGKCATQKMADLPVSRFEESPPFTHCGVDCFGPFVVKEGRREVKRYGLMLTCLASRAVHIECLDDMTSDSFIQGLRCFIAIRGPVRSLYSDQGSNFVGASGELERALGEISDESLRKFLQINQCSFVMNEPRSSHKGGVWERQIRSVRAALETLVNQHSGRLDTSSLRTLFYEAMAVVNSRPLTMDSLNDPGGLEPITPNLLLTSKTNVALPPPGAFQAKEVYAYKRWRKVQWLANQFWQQWRKRYLQDLQERSKWTRPKRNFVVGDIVLLKEDDPIRGKWTLARVVKVFCGEDKLVRKVELLTGDRNLSDSGRRQKAGTYLTRPVHKLILLFEASDVERKSE